MKPSTPPVCEKTVVLIGGGHAHVQVIKYWGMHRGLPVKLILISERYEAVYSGMVPGFVAGDYGKNEVSINLVGLCKWAGVEMVRGFVGRVDPESKTVYVLDHPPVEYDVLSINIGSTVTVPESIPTDRLLATRPILDFVGGLKRFNNYDKAHKHIAVVGGGAAAYEVALCTRARWNRENYTDLKITIVCSSNFPLDGYSKRTRALAKKSLEANRIDVVPQFKAESWDKGFLLSNKGRSLACDKIIWAAGAVAHPCLQHFGVDLDEGGYISVQKTLQTHKYPDVFAVGDCNNFVEKPLPKAGVYSVRQGPFLIHNILAYLASVHQFASPKPVSPNETHGSRGLRPYKPQSRFLSLLNNGDGTALLQYGIFGAMGPWVFRWKDKIDRRFMDSFNPAKFLEEKGEVPAPTHPELPDMWCGGCGSKFSGPILKDVIGDINHNLWMKGEGQDKRESIPWEDGAEVERSGNLTKIHTVDYLRSCISDPYLFGKIATLHSLNDIDAMGGKAEWAMALASVPHFRRSDSGATMAKRQLRDMLTGAAEILESRQAKLVGGHTLEGEELHFGLSLQGVVEGEPFRKSSAGPGELIGITKPLGTGVILALAERGFGKVTDYEDCLETMLLDNGVGARVLRSYNIGCVTDISGFGLAGHLMEILRASKMGARLYPSQIPLLPGVLDALKKGFTSSLHSENQKYCPLPGLEGSDSKNSSGEIGDALYDPQTSGGLLFTVPAHRGEPIVADLRAAGYEQAQIIGEITGRDELGKMELV